MKGAFMRWKNLDKSRAKLERDDENVTSQTHIRGGGKVGRGLGRERD